jgi:hypothetical protein
MQLARIITNSVDDSLELSMQLRSRGFRVETVTPDHIPDTPADVEVRLEECAPEDVLTQSAIAKESEDLWVFVAPGALDERARPMRVIPLVPQTAEGSAPKRTRSAIQLRAAVESMQAEPEEDLIMAELESRRVQAQVLPAKVQVPDSNGTNESSASLAPLAAETSTASVVVIKLSEPAHSEMAVKPVIEVPAPVKPPQQSATVRAIAAPSTTTWEIPKVPERVEPKSLPLVAAQSVATGRAQTYKIRFRGASRFWQLSCAAIAVTVLAGLLAIVVAVRPILPDKTHSTAATGQPVSVSQSAKPGSGAVRQTQGPGLPAHPPAAAHKEPTPVTIPAQAIPPAEPSHRARPASGDGLIAEDTVIFYDRKPAHPQPKVSSRTGVRRYSDAN